MKYTFYIVLIVALLFSMTACGIKEPNYEVAEFPASIGELSDRMQEYFDAVHGKGAYNLKVDKYPFEEDLSIWIEPEEEALHAFIRPMITSEIDILPCARLSVMHGIEDIIRLERYAPAMLWACGVGDNTSDRLELIDRILNIFEDDSGDTLDETVDGIRIIFHQYEEPDRNSPNNHYELIVEPIR